jgi:hypothetical protein
MNKQRVRELRRLRNQAFAAVKHWDTQVDLAKAEITAAKLALHKFLEGLNRTENLWRRIEADDFIASHRQRIRAAHQRREDAWQQLIRAKQEEARAFAQLTDERYQELCAYWATQRRLWELKQPGGSAKKNRLGE